MKIQKTLTVDELFDVVNESCDHSGDAVAYQAYDRVFMVELGSEELDQTTACVISFNGWEVTTDDVCWDEENDVWYQDDCRDYSRIILTKDGHVLSCTPIHLMTQEN